MASQKIVSLRNGLHQVEVLEAGSGPDVLYLHGIWDGTRSEFVDRLGQRFHMIAPRHPGFGQSTGEDQLVDIFDLTYYYLDLLDALGIDHAPLIGHCLGGMFAAELAATQPRRFPKLALLAPFGLWNEAHQTLDFFATPGRELAAALHGPNSPEAAEAAKPPAPPSGTPTPEEQQRSIRDAVERAKAMSVAARFLWPLPNRGLKKRLHRVTMPTLLLWGAKDGVVPPAYADDFRALLPAAKKDTLPGGHLAHYDAIDKAAAIVESFLGS